MSIKKSLGRFGSRFAFEFFLENMHEKLIEALKKYLKDITPEKIKDLIKRGEFVSVDSLDFSAAGENADYIGKISLVRLMNFIGEARPDLLEAIQDMGEAGAEYMVRLRIHLLKKLREPARLEFTPQKDTVLAKCDQCGGSIPVSRGAPLPECPICHGNGLPEQPS